VTAAAAGVLVAAVVFVLVRQPWIPRVSDSAVQPARSLGILSDQSLSSPTDEAYYRYIVVRRTCQDARQAFADAQWMSIRDEVFSQGSKGPSVALITPDAESLKEAHAADSASQAGCLLLFVP
jgi:hypothetical protein